MATLKRAMLNQPKELAFIDLPFDPETLGEHQVYAVTEVSAVSTGTEMAAYSGQPPLRPSTTYPRLVGYCNIASVLKVGRDVRGVAAGDRVITHQSHQSAFICSDAEILAIVPDGIPSDAASLTFLGELGLSALRATEFPDGGYLAVLGLGTIGLATVGVARALGAHVMAIGNDEFRLEKALEQGAHATVLSDDPDLKKKLNEFTRGNGIDVVVTTINAWSAWRTALEIPRMKGKIAVLGFPGRSEGPPSFNPLDSSLFYDKQLTVQACGISSTLPLKPGDVHFNCQKNLELLLQWTRDGKLALGKLITHRVPWYDLERIYEMSSRHDKSLIGAILDWKIKKP